MFGVNGFCGHRGLHLFIHFWSVYEFLSVLVRVEVKTQTIRLEKNVWLANRFTMFLLVYEESAELEVHETG
jgi:hypothetical protein